MGQEKSFQSVGELSQSRERCKPVAITKRSLANISGSDTRSGEKMEVSVEIQIQTVVRGLAFEGVQSHPHTVRSNGRCA